MSRIGDDDLATGDLARRTAHTHRMHCWSVGVGRAIATQTSARATNRIELRGEMLCDAEHDERAVQCVLELSARHRVPTTLCHPPVTRHAPIGRQTNKQTNEQTQTVCLSVLTGAARGLHDRRSVRPERESARQPRQLIADRAARHAAHDDRE